MALKKSIQTQFGIPAEYWRIIRINESFDSLTEVLIAGYVSHEKREEGSNPLQILSRTFETLDGGRDDYYVKLKESVPGIQDTNEKDENGNPITAEVESNIFADAIDC